MAGVSSAVVGYDFSWMQAELSVGFALGGNPLLDVDIDDVYVTNIGLAFPVHRGFKCDFGLLVRGGVVILNPVAGDDIKILGSAAGGGRFRIFQTPNVDHRDARSWRDLPWRPFQRDHGGTAARRGSGGVLFSLTDSAQKNNG